MTSASYQQELRRGKGKLLRTLAALGLMVVGLFVVLTLSRLLAPYVKYLDVILLVALVSALYLMMRGYVLEYRYRLADGRLSVERVAGERGRPLVRVQLSDTLYFGVPEKAPRADRTLRYTLPGHDGENRVLVCREDAGTVLLVLQPDEEMSRLLLGAVDANKNEN